MEGGPVWKKKTGLVAELNDVMRDATAGDPVTGLKWSHKTLRKIRKTLRKRSYRTSAPTVGRLLRHEHYALRVNRKRLAGRSPDRDRQFAYISRVRRAYLRCGHPVISVDSKKRELVGLFKNAGRAWRQRAVDVNMYDFPSIAVGIALLYGIYDVGRNRGFVSVGNSHDTPQFAVAAIRTWWRLEGRVAYPGHRRLLINADGGGSNGCRERMWKLALQQFADETGLVITVTHYPTGASKWNLIEHRMFCFISANWAGQPLDTYETIVKYIRTTRTATGFRCRAHLDTTTYQTGLKVSDKEMASLRVKPRKVYPKWNYTIYPRTSAHQP